MSDEKEKGSAIVYGVANVIASIMIVSSPCSSSLSAFFAIILVALLNIGVYLLGQVFPDTQQVAYDKFTQIQNSLKSHAS
jgi:uncharacterized membrane protein